MKMGKLLWVYNSLFLDDEFVSSVGFATICEELALNQFLQFSLQDLILEDHLHFCMLGL